MQREEKCLACGQDDEGQTHTCECSVLRREYWKPFLTILNDTGTPVPPDREVAALLAVGRISDDKMISNESSGVLFAAWRALYAEIIKSRIEETRPNWKRAARKGIGIIINRLTARGEFWRKWYRSIYHTSRHQLFPKDHQDHPLMHIDDEAHYTINPILKAVYDSI